MASQAEYTVTCELMIPPKLIDTLKQTGRRLFQLISNDCGDAVIGFPTAGSNRDMVIISGPEDDVAKAKQQLLQFFKETHLSGFSAEVRVKVEYQKLLREKNRVDIKEIGESTETQISFPTNEDEDKEVITIIGKQDAVDEAKAKLETIVKQISNSQSLFKAKVLNQIIEECKGVKISFPHTGVESDPIVIKGDRDCVKAAEEQLLEIVKELESMVTVECKIPQRQRSTVIGAKGCNVQGIRARFNVQIRFSDRVVKEEQQRPDEQGNGDDVEAEETDPDYDIVQITGRPDEAEAAKQALLTLLPITIKVDVPNYLHRAIIGQGGCGVKELKKKYHVQIVLSQLDQKLDYVTITGKRACVEEAKEAILEKCKYIETAGKEKALKYFELKIQVDSDYHQKVISHSEGDAIKKIMSDNDVAITFPSVGNPKDNVITITGYQNDVHKARADLTKIINELSSSALSIDSEMIECQGTDVEQKTQDLSNVDKEINEMEDEIEIEGETEEAEEVQTEIQKLHERLSMSHAAISLVQKHTNIVTDTLKYCDNVQERLTELFNNISLKKEKKINELKDHLNNQVSMNKALEIERTQLRIEINGKKEQCEEAIHKNQQKYAQKINEMSERIKDVERKLNFEQKEKSKLISENTETSKWNEELLSERRALRTRLTEEEQRTKSLEDNNRELMEGGKQSNIEIAELKSTNSALISSHNSVIADYRKQLEESKITLGKTVNKMNEEISNSMKLRSIIVKGAEDDKRLKDNEISKLRINLEEASKNNEKLSKNIQILNRELGIKVKQIRDSATDFQKYKANVDENVIKEKANHELKMEQIKSNIHDLKQKLSEITQDIHNPNEITPNSSSITGIFS